MKLPNRVMILLFVVAAAQKSALVFANVATFERR